MITEPSTKLWSLSDDPNQYQRYVNLLSGELKNSLTPELINQQTLQAGLSNLVAKDRIEIIHDGSDIRKPYSKTLPHLAKVKSLEKQIINGYNTFNSVVISDVSKRIHLLRSTPYSTSDPAYNQRIGGGFTENSLVFNQIIETDAAIKSKFPAVKVRHLFDRGHDDKELFKLIDELRSNFIVRLKTNRNSNEFSVDESGKQRVYTKLINARLDHSGEQDLEKFIWKNKVFQNAKLMLVWGTFILEERSYSVVRIQVLDRNMGAIFKNDMLLITNELVGSFVSAFEIYKAYVRRSKIENVFKFLKDQLGWEEFQVRDFFVIQNILSLCFFVGGYFYESHDALVSNPEVILICELAKSKGKVTRYFYLEGLKVLANFILFQDFIHQQGLTQEQVNQLLSMV